MSIENYDQPTRNALFEYLTRLGDDLLVLGHRNSEWCGHAPILEEDLAMANIALDCIGQAEALLNLAGEVEGKGRSEDDLAYFRDEFEFHNIQLVEQPRGDYSFSILRQFLFSSFTVLFYEQLAKSSFKPLADIAAKAVVEMRYQVRHCRSWVIRMGDGTEESHRRIAQSLEDLWIFTGEMFASDELDSGLAEQGLVPKLSELRSAWLESVGETLKTATLEIPSDEFMIEGGRRGLHSEHLGHLLAEMQIVARSHPGAKW